MPRPTYLHSVLRDRLDVSDITFARLCFMHRSEIHDLRTGRRRVGTISSDKANAILQALRMLGVSDATFEKLVGNGRRRKAA